MMQIIAVEVMIWSSASEVVLLSFNLSVTIIASLGLHLLQEVKRLLRGTLSDLLTFLSPCLEQHSEGKRSVDKE